MRRGFSSSCSATRPIHWAPKTNAIMSIGISTTLMKNVLVRTVSRNSRKAIVAILRMGRPSGSGDRPRGGDTCVAVVADQAHKDLL